MSQFFTIRTNYRLFVILVIRYIIRHSLSLSIFFLFYILFDCCLCLLVVWIRKNVKIASVFYKIMCRINLSCIKCKCIVLRFIILWSNYCKFIFPIIIYSKHNETQTVYILYIIKVTTKMGLYVYFVSQNRDNKKMFKYFYIRKLTYFCRST